VDFTSYCNQSSGGDELGTQWLLKKERVAIWDAETEAEAEAGCLPVPSVPSRTQSASWFEGGCRQALTALGEISFLWASHCPVRAFVEATKSNSRDIRVMTIEPVHKFQFVLPHPFHIIS
jgi:hypothetical protein